MKGTKERINQLEALYFELNDKYRELLKSTNGFKPTPEIDAQLYDLNAHTDRINDLVIDLKEKAKIKVLYCIHGAKLRWITQQSFSWTIGMLASQLGWYTWTLEDKHNRLGLALNDFLQLSDDDFWPFFDEYAKQFYSILLHEQVFYKLGPKALARKLYNQGKEHFDLEKAATHYNLFL